MKQYSLTRVAVLGVIIALFGLVALGYNGYNRNLNSLLKLNQENLAWTSEQLKFEYTLFMRDVSGMRAGVEGFTPRSVNNRFDILWSRVSQSEQGSVGERLRSYDTDRETLSRLNAALHETEAQVVGLQQNDNQTIDAIKQVFAPFDRELRDFHRMVFLGEETKVAEIRSQLFQGGVFTALVTLTAFLLTGGALLWVNWESAKNEKMAAYNRELATAAENANAAKSQFLTMMSHELRTPMNGVLGMLALAKQPGLALPQLRLVEQAEKSGKQMISMLSDILDYASLQDDDIQLEQKPLEIQRLASAVSELFGSVARREGIDFNVAVNPECPERIEGDFKRLRQIIAHFASFIVETAGTEDVNVDFGYKGGYLTVTISFDYIGDGLSASWKPEILLGTLEQDEQKFATDALGPAVARGILDQMGGRVTLDYPAANQISVKVKVPAKTVDIGEMLVFIDSNSLAVKTLCGAALSGMRARIVDEDYDGPVHMVLVETGGLGEMERVKYLSRRFRTALMIAIGKPINPADFDGELGLPLDVGEIRASLKRTVAH